MNYDGLALRQLKADQIGQWIETYWIPEHPEQRWTLSWSLNVVTMAHVHQKFSKRKLLKGGYRLADIQPYECPEFPRINSHAGQGSGWLMTFAHTQIRRSVCYASILASNGKRALLTLHRSLSAIRSLSCARW